MLFARLTRSLAAGAACVLLATGSVGAEDNTAAEGAASPSDLPPASMTRALDVAMARISQDLSHKEVGVLNLAAHATAAAGLCVDIGLDEGAVYGALTEVAHEATAEMSEDEAARHRDFSLIAFGVLTGIMLQQGAEDETAFCDEAVQVAQDPELEKFIRIVSTAVPYEAPKVAQ